MKRSFFYLLLCAVCLGVNAKKVKKQTQPLWPDGTPIAEWFNDTTKVDVNTLGKKYVITEYGVKNDSTIVQTEAIQKVIDLAASNGGGVIVIPRGTYLSGSLFFKQGTHLYVEEGGTLKGSDRIANFKILETRIEGQTCKYFSALVNADGIDGFVIAGKGTINGDGRHYWEEFWIRRQWNRECTNKDAQRPRLTYISNSKNVTVQDVHLINSPFWTNHIYKSDHARYIDCYIYAPTSGIKAPSSDAIDIDVCHDVLVHGCYMNVNDDAVVLKGGKGTWADKDANNGPNYNILIQNCHYGTVHGCLTLGSESVHDRNVIIRNCHADNANRVIWLKMRPDTPQHYEYVTVENFTGNTGSFLVVRPWTQFFQPENREDMPLSTCNNIVMKNINMECKNFFDVGASDKYKLIDFTFENIDVKDQKNAFTKDIIENTIIKNMKINGVEIK
ncbi:MAG: exopolygalacturonase [Prevotella sp.]|nr:exopolygalacturonase [Prevotella sp.]